MTQKASKKKYHAVFVSPHLDDAVFSCAAEIFNLVKEGPVLVINLFTRFPENVSKNSVILGPERYKEEQEASLLLGFQSVNLEQIDASLRRPKYKKISQIFMPPVQEDLEYLQNLQEIVMSFLEQIEFSNLYLPLGIGWHVDHILTHKIFEFYKSSAKILFYEDAPYCLLSHATSRRLQELGTFEQDPIDDSLNSQSNFIAASEALQSFKQTGMMKNIKPTLLRLIAIPIVGIYFYRLLFLHQKNKIKSQTQRKLKPLVKNVTTEFPVKLDAIKKYASQFEALFGSDQDCRNLYQRYSKSLGGKFDYVERFWYLA